MPVWPEKVRYRTHPPDPRYKGATLEVKYPTQPTTSVPSRPSHWRTPIPVLYAQHVWSTPYTTTPVGYRTAPELIQRKLPSPYDIPLTGSQKVSAVETYMQSEEWKTYISSPRGQEQLEATRESMAREGLSPLDIVTVVGVDVAKAEKRLARQRLFGASGDFEKDFWEGLDWQVKYKQLFQEGVVSGGLAIPTLAEMGLSFAFKTPTPISEWQQERYISYTPGFIEAGVSELLTGGKDPSFERISAKPEHISEATFKTGASFIGFVAGGGIFKIGKMGFKRVTSPVARGIERKLGVPSLSAYRPTNLFRKLRWKYRERVGKAGYLPEEQIWDPYVLSGKKRFAELIGPKEQLKLFEKTKMLDIFPEKDIIGIHTTPYRFHKLTYIKKGYSELPPGLRVSAFGRGSPHFLRLGGYGYSGKIMPTRISLFPQLHMPTAPLFRLKKVVRLPKYLRHSGKKAAEYIKKLPKGKYAHIAPKVEMGGPEIEAIIKKGTWGLRTRGFYYTTYKGVVVPLPEYELLGKWLPRDIAFKFGEKLPGKVKDFLSFSYQTTPSVPLVGPSLFVSKASIVSRPSYPSMPSVPSSVTSYLSKASIPSPPSVPSVPSPPSYPSIPSGPSIPSIPSYPSVPSIPSVPSVPSPPSYPSPPKYPPVVPPSLSYGPIKKLDEPGYFVMVKTRQYVKGKPRGSEKFRRLTSRPLGYGDAKSLMGSALDHSIAQSGFLKPSDGPAKSLHKKVPSRWSSISHKFDVKKGRFIESRSYAIDTKGEVDELDVYRWYRGLPGKRIEKQRQRIIGEYPSMDMSGFDNFQASFEKALGRVSM